MLVQQGLNLGQAPIGRAMCSESSSAHAMTVGVTAVESLMLCLM